MKCYCVTQFHEPLQMLEQHIPEPTGAQVLLKTRAAGVCHSDLHIWEGGYDLGHGKRLSLTDRGIKLPLTMGHETVGTAAAWGPDATGIDRGKNYLVFPWLGCGDCIVCVSGRENYCAKPRSIGIYQNGGYADHILVPDSRYLLDIGDLNPAQIAPVACSGLTTFSAIKKLDPALYQHAPIVIMGAGGLGLMCLQILKAMGGVGAIVVDIDPLKLEAAKEAGALATVNGTDPDALEQILKANGNQAIGAVIDLVGSAQSTALGFNALIKGGTLVIVGFFGGAAPWSLALIPMKAISILGNYTGSLGELQALMALVKSGQIKPIEVSEYPLSEASSVLAALGAGKIIGRAVLVD